MSVFNLFSKRQQKLRGEFSDVYIYNTIPQPLRIQIVHIVNDCFGLPKTSYGSSRVSNIYEAIFGILCREYGRFSLLDNRQFNAPQDQVLNFLLMTKSVDEALDVIELLFKSIDILKDDDYQFYSYHSDVKISPSAAIEELNERFRENGVGFSYENGEIIKIDSTYMHSEIVKPTLSLLHNDKFAGANEEYLKAHEHYRHGRNKECLSECLKAFESTMKIICKEKGWTFGQTDTSKKLIQICFQNGLVPSFTQNQFTSLLNLLESGIPTIRNKLGGHGQGHIPQKVDDEMTRYGLNLTGSNIIFLIEQSDI